MTQGLFAGCTEYESQSIDNIKEDIINWKKYSEKIKKEFHDVIQNLTEVGYWKSTVPIDFQIFCCGMQQLCDAFSCDFDKVLSAIVTDKITKREITLMENIHRTAHKKERELVSAYKNDLDSWCQYDDDNFAKTEQLYRDGRDFFVTLFDVDNAAGRMEHYMKDETIVDNSIHAENSVIIGNGNKINDTTINNNINHAEKNLCKWLSENVWCPLIVAIITGIVIWLITGT